MDDHERRQTLGAFLRTRRSRLRPADVSLPTRSRRRTPGLRREEVAELANISVSWYTLLEQGQDIHPSAQVLENLAQALKLSPSEVQHLYLLARQELPAARLMAAQIVTPPLQRVIDALSPNPTFVISPRWDVLTSNRVAELLFQFDQPYPPHSKNVVWRFFVRQQARQVDLDWEHQAKNLVAQFRADYVRFPGVAAFQTLVEDLQRISPHFCEWWAQQDVRGFPDGPRTMNHPALGLLEFDHVTFQTSTTPDLRVKVYAAMPATAAKLEHLLQQTDT